MVDNSTEDEIAQKTKRPIVRRTTRRGAPEPVERSATGEEAPVTGAFVTRNRGVADTRPRVQQASTEAWSRPLEKGERVEREGRRAVTEHDP